MVKTLLDHGADKNIKNNKGETALSRVLYGFSNAKDKLGRNVVNEKSTEVAKHGNVALIKTSRNVQRTGREINVVIVWDDPKDLAEDVYKWERIIELLKAP